MWLIRAAVLVSLVAVPRALRAGGLQNHCIIRSIEESGGNIRVTADVDRNEVEQHLQAHAQSAVVQAPGVTIADVKLGKIVWNRMGPTDLGVIVDVGAKVEILGISVPISGTVTAQVKVGIVEATAVHAELTLDKFVVPAHTFQPNKFIKIQFQGLTVQLPRTIVAGFSSQFQLPGAARRIQSVGITSVDPAWFAVVVEIEP
jgi:hypothetical protein